MTIQIANNNPRISYVATAGQTAFPTSFAFFVDGDINVYINDVLKTLATDYTVAGGSGLDGTVTLVTGATVGDIIVLTRDVELERTTDFPTSGPFQVASLNVELDKLVAMIADMEDFAGRGLRLSDSDTSAALVLANKDARKGTVLAFNTVTGAVEVGPTIADTQSIADIKADIAALADIEDGTVATDAISDLAAIASDVTTAASNIVAIQGASTEAANAATSATAAATSASAAATSASAAATSATAAETAETNAETAETNAETAETNASTSATAAASSATAAAGSATAAASSATAAASSATAASTSETNAGTSETNAATSATAAAGSATAAAGSATAAASSATAAASSATAAASSATAASSSEDSAQIDADAAALSATEATTQAGIATTQATNAATSATAAATSATAASASQVAAASSAAAAANTFDSFDDTYLGSKASDPTVDNDGDALTTGDLYFNTADNEMRVYDGANWIAASSAGGASLLNYNYTATAGQTTFTGADDNAATLSYTTENLIVTLNGVVLEDGTDYTASNGTSIVLTDGAVVDDELNIVAFKSFTTADMVSATTGGTFNGNVTVDADATVTGDLTVDTSTLHVDSTNNRVGVGTASPSEQLHVANADDAVALIESTGTDSGDDARLEVKTTNGTFTIQNDRSLGTSGALTFAGNTSNNIVIDHNSGFVGVGTATPAQDFVLYEATEPRIALQNSSSGTGEFDGFQIQSNVNNAFLWNYESAGIRFGTSASTRMVISSSGAVSISASSGNGYLSVPQAYAGTTGGAANMHILSNGNFLRSVSSDKYKTGIEDAELSYAEDLYNLRPVYYKSLGTFDDPNHGHWGFVAEEVAQIDPRLCFYKTTEMQEDDNGDDVEVTLDNPVVEGVQYDRMIPLMLKLMKEQKDQIETLQTKVAALEAN